MRTRALAILAVAALLIPAACMQPEAATEAEPRLVVMISVDQLRGDLLERYSDAFTGGFRRLMDEGAWFTQASHRHASTSTGIGHASISTAVHPTRHGIVGNSWSERMEDGTMRSVYAVEDSMSPLLGFPNAEGRSPANIRRTGLADWMVEQDSRTRVLSVSSKDRGAIPMAGQARGHVYWLMGSAGRFATSTWYRDDYPEWVELFNRERMPEILGNPVWEYQPNDMYDGLTRADVASYEGNGEHTDFPHLREEESPGDSPSAQFGWAARTPAADRATLEFALEAIDQLNLGGQDQVDYLGLSFSATDYVGHGYGPLSREQFDNLVRLDQLLGRLMATLDERLGEDGWVLGLSADHGVVTMPEYLQELGEPGHRTSSEDWARFQSVVDSVEAAMAGSDRAEIDTALAVALEQIEWVHDVMLPAELQQQGADSIVNLFANSFDPDRYWSMLPEQGLYVAATEGTYTTSSSTGTGHGSPWWYDRWVPLILYGPGVSAGQLTDEVYTVDLAPSLAAMVGITTPADLDGRPLIN